jgi:eukaryotic-like serine/threonine-protein kinase
MPRFAMRQLRKERTMEKDAQVEQLIDTLLQGDTTPEQVCKSRPDLLPEIRRRWRMICEIRDELDSMFPTPSAKEAGRATVSYDSAELPRIPGYEVESLLGRGGMGVVFRARHIRLNRVVALKMVLSGAYAGQQERERFQREAEAIAALRYPNVVQVYDIGESEGRPYFTMEFLEGGSLSGKLASAPQRAAEAAALAATLARAVHAAHAAGIVHRDLKPANVLLTADGVAKITDFGLARRLDDGAALTRTGATLGTPSYMAPEQSLGKPSAVGPAVDIYALGAILYEMLTGRPPFLAETPHDTFQQAATREPVPPSRLNAKVTRDLETICLKCLRKEPQDRYASAAALAGDLDSFLCGEPISARPEGAARRVLRRILRRPVQSALTAAGTLLVLVSIGVGACVVIAREAEKATARATQRGIERDVKDDLADMVKGLKKSAWSDARDALERAKGRLENLDSPELSAQVEHGEADLKLTAQLAKIRLDRAVADGPTASVEYEKAFRDAGFCKIGDNPEAIAERIKQSNVKQALLDAFDDWSAGALYQKGGQERWLLDVARRADPDPTGWRDRLRDPHVRKDQRALLALAQSATIDETPVSLLVELADLLYEIGGDPTPFLVKVQQRHPDDLWANWLLGHIERDPSSAMRYYQAALAIRPDTPYLYSSMGAVLRASDHADDALFYANKAVELAPKNGICRALLASCLMDLGREKEAMDEVKIGIHMPCDQGGRLLFNEVERKSYWIHGNWQKLRTVWQAQLLDDPPNHADWYGFAELCLYLGAEDSYRQCRTKMLAKFGATVDPAIAERTGRACLLLPASGEELRRAVALTRFAASTKRPEYASFIPFFHFAEGLGEYRQGHYGRAAKILSSDPLHLPSPAPRLVLAMALQQSGKKAEAKAAFDKAVQSYDWRPTQVHDQDDWICHVLRREAESMIAATAHSSAP